MQRTPTRRQFLKQARAIALGSLGAFQAPAWIARSAGVREWRITGHDAPGLALFDAAMQRFMAARGISAGALAVAYQGRLVLAHGYSYSDTGETVEPTALFRIASITKPITATAIMRLVQEQRLALADKVATLLQLSPPPGRTADARLANITVLHLLQHLGGWDRNLAFDPMFYDPAIAFALGGQLPISRQQIMTYMTGQPLQHAPGTTYVYSNYGYRLLGAIVERITGQPYAQFVREQVLYPLNIYRMRLGRTAPANRAPGEVTYQSIYTGKTCLDASGVIVPYPYGGFNLENMDSHGGWLASAIDLVRFASIFDQPAGSAVLNDASIATMFAPPAIGMQRGGWYYGCGWSVWPVGTSRNTWHDGSLAGSSTLLVRRWDGITWAVLFNQRDDPNDPQGSSYSAIDQMLHNTADSVAPWPSHDFYSEYLPALDQKTFLPTML